MSLKEKVGRAAGRKIVVTGALGHIGSRLIRELPSLLPLKELVLIDNLSTQRFSAIFDLPDNAPYRFHRLDVTRDDLRPFIAEADAVLHFAAITDAESSFDRRDELVRVNHGGTAAVAKACAELGVPMFFPSSTSVYGSQNALVDENCPEADLLPQSPYAETKLREEKLLRDLAKEQGLNFVIARLGTIAGVSPGMRFHTAVNKFCWQAVMGEVLTVWKTALDQKRPYLDLGDATRAIAFMIENQVFGGGTYNIVTANATVRDIVESIRRDIPDAEVSFVESRIMNQLSYEVSRARFEKLGFEFSGSIDGNIRETIRLLRNANVKK